VIKKWFKIKGVQIQRLENKIEVLRFGDGRPMLATVAGARITALRMLNQINPANYPDLDERITFYDYMANSVERKLPRFAREYAAKHGDYPNVTIALGSISTVGDEKSPVAATIYDGVFDYETDYTAIGSGSLIVEILLRDSYSSDITVDFGKKLVAYIIQSI